MPWPFNDRAPKGGGNIRIAETPPKRTRAKSTVVDGKRRRMGNCMCPDQLQANGRRCGDKAALKRPGGLHPVCDGLKKVTDRATQTGEDPQTIVDDAFGNPGQLHLSEEQDQFVRDVFGLDPYSPKPPPRVITPDEVKFDYRGRPYVSAPNGAKYITQEKAEQLTGKPVGSPTQTRSQIIKDLKSKGKWRHEEASSFFPYTDRDNRYNAAQVDETLRRQKHDNNAARRKELEASGAAFPESQRQFIPRTPTGGADLPEWFDPKKHN